MGQHDERPWHERSSRTGTAVVAVLILAFGPAASAVSWWLNLDEPLPTTIIWILPVTVAAMLLCIWVVVQAARWAQKRWPPDPEEDAGDTP